MVYGKDSSGAGEAGVPALSISGSDLVSSMRGGWAEQIRTLFGQARKLAPCIIFIDEIDAIGLSRNYGGDASVLTQLLTEMDGFGGRDPVLTLAATNRPEVLDPALRRPGRFDREIPVELPDVAGREEILRHYLEKTRAEEKITVLPRTGGALGYTMQLDPEQRYLYTRTELENRILTLVAGRAAEELHFHEVTTGASNDIEKATQTARQLVARYGMTEEFDMVSMEVVTGGYLGSQSQMKCSDATARLIDEKVVEIVREQHQKALELLRVNEDSLDRLSQHIYEKETITGEEFMTLLAEDAAKV